jgi:hypothetical protein
MAERIVRISLIILIAALACSCVTTVEPKPKDTPPVTPDGLAAVPFVEGTEPLGSPGDTLPADPPPAKDPVTTDKPEFDPTTVTKEVYEATLVDIRIFIETLNSIIRGKDYESWISYLTDEYITEVSDPAYLAKISETPVLKRRAIVLKSLKDYFLNVVVPSRANDRVDEIEFVGEDRIIAFTLNPKGERLVLYYLEKVDKLWKIGIGR